MYIIGLDVGTTGTKAALLDEKGSVLAKGYKEYELVTTEDRGIEQSADDWWDAAVYAIRKATEAIDPKQVRAIGLSTQGSTQVPVDKDFNCLAPAMTWMDKRASKEGEAINRALGGPDGDGVYRRTGWGTGPATDSSKILWLRANRKEIYDKTAYFVSTVEFMNFKLTGKNVIDPTNGTIRGLINATSGDYDPDILSFLQIGRDKLPTILPTGALVGKLTPQAAEATGLSTECEVYNGAHDQYCASLGSGTVDKGDMLIATGTTWVIFGIADRLMFCPSRIATGIHPVKGRYGALASMVSAGSSLKWFVQQFGGDYKEVDEVASTRRESAKNIYFFPYLAGAGFPRRNPALRSTVLGLELRHDKYDMALALMEAVAFEAKAGLKVFEENGLSCKKLVMAGGAAKSRLWSEIVGYTVGREMYRTQEADTCCVGAAMLAAVGCGLFPDYETCSKDMAKLEPFALPDGSLFEFYKAKYERYQAAYGPVKALYESMK